MSKHIRRFVPALLLAAVLVCVLANTAFAAVWSSTAAFGSTTLNGYTLNNDVWGSGAGPQTIWANSGTNWGVWSNQPNTGGVKSYPHSGISIGSTLSSLHSVTSSFNVSVPGSGAYESAYDIWANGSSYEIMLWLNKTGAVGPIGSYQTNVSVGGYNWNVYSGSNGSNPVFSFLNTGSASSGTVDILATLKWIESKGWYGNVTLSQVQFGFEITSSSGGLNFVANNLTISHS
jgi:Glycosyl hydrolase family 12